MNTDTTAENQAIAEAAQPSTALTLPERAAIALGESANAAKLRELVSKSAGIVTVTNNDGRDEAHRAGMVLLKTRTGIRTTGKAARDDATKFSKAVIAMEDDLIAIIEPEEQRVLKLRDEFDEQIAAEKAAKIAAERLRMEMIASAIEGIRERETDVLRKCKTAEETNAEIARLEELQITEFVFQERVGEAADIKARVLMAMRIIHGERIEAEQAAADAEAARLAEIARLAAERAELDRQRAEQAEAARLAKIESDRIAAEQAVESKRLADLAAAQEAEAKARRDAAEAQRLADSAAQADAIRRTKEAADAELKAKADAHAEQVRADEAYIALRKKELDHEEALIQNRTFDAGILILRGLAEAEERARLQALADQNIADKRAMADDERMTGCPMSTQPYVLVDADGATISGATNMDAGILTVIDIADAEPYPADDELVDLIMEVFGMSEDDVTRRLLRFADDARAAGEVAA
jgi:hypothetical protein